MKCRLLSLSFFTVCVITLAAVNLYGQTKPAAVKKPNEQFFPLEQVKPGMRAIGYTVFEGREPRKFELEILGVLQGQQNPQQNAVLSRLLGDEMQHKGVFQGMSGSPVFIDGKLLGAVAFGYQFAKDPIAGITPIQQMVEVFEQRASESNDKPADKPRPLSFSEIAFQENSREFQAFVSGLQTPQSKANASFSGLQPIATPLAITGVPSGVIAQFAPQFQAWGFNPVAGLAGAARISELKKADANTLKPGSTVVVPLIRGDLSIAAAGTVTWRDGDKIYAFGHPFLSMGVSDFPMNEGEVVTVMPGQAISFKISNPTATVGAIRGDRTPGIYGELGVEAKMIPVEIALKTSRGEQHTYKIDVVKDRFLTPILMQMTVMSAISSTERMLGDSTLRLSGMIKLQGQPEIRFENRLSTSMNAPLAAAFATSQPISALLSSGFKDVQFEKITLDITSRDARSTGQLDRLWINRSEVRRGEQLEIQAFARTENGGEYVERILLEIPQDAPLGPLQIIVGDGPAIQASEARTGFTPKSLSQLVRELNRLRKADRLYVRLAKSDGGAVINNEELPSLPPSVLATLSSERTAGGYTLTGSATVFEKELPPAEFVISGRRALTVNVVNQ